MPQWNSFILLGHVTNNKNSMNVITITNAYQSHAYQKIKHDIESSFYIMFYSMNLL